MSLKSSYLPDMYAKQIQNKKPNGWIVASLLLGLGLGGFIIYAQILSVLMIQNALKERGLHKKTRSNLKAVYASNVIILIGESAYVLMLLFLFTVLLIALFRR